MSLEFDLRDFQRAARRMHALERQIPFALSQALNASAEIARTELIEKTWPEHVEVRNRSFIRASLTTKDKRASKKKLRVVIYDRLDHGNLKLHDEGGIRRARGKGIAIPNADLQARRSGKGVPKGMRPRNLPNSFITDGRRPNPHLKPNTVYQRQGGYRAKDTVISRTGKKRKAAADFRTVKLMYTLKPSVPIRADVPFHRDFNRNMRRTMPKQFRIAMRRAMATALKTK